MIELINDKLVIRIDEKAFSSLAVINDSFARARLSKIWDTDQADLAHYLAVFYDKGNQDFSDSNSFMTLSFNDNGYIIDSNELIDVAEARKQIEIDLEIINRESQWNKEESIYFDRWWPKPTIDMQKHLLEFGVSLKDFHGKVFNRTVNHIILTRFGYVSINYSLSEQDILEDKPLSYFQGKLDEVVAALDIETGYRFEDIDEDNDMPSRSRMINLLLSSEIF